MVEKLASQIPSKKVSRTNTREVRYANIDVSNETPNSRRYLDLFQHHGMRQHIEKSTRKGIKLIDHIIKPQQNYRIQRSLV